MTLEDIRNASAILGFLTAVVVGVGGWLAWRAVVNVHLETLKKSVEGVGRRIDVMANRIDRMFEDQADFEKEAGLTFATRRSVSEIKTDLTNAISGLRLDISTMGHAIFERLDRLFSNK